MTIMEKNSKMVLRLLRKAVEAKYGSHPLTTHDFEAMSEAVNDANVGYVSASTLKRFWGYVKDSGSKHTATLDVLSRYAGYAGGYAEFARITEERCGVESGYDHKRVLDVTTLKPEDEVEVKWLPDRKVVLRCLGDCRLEVVKSENAKLQEGLQVCCPRIIEGEKLIVDIIGKEGGKPMVYEAGKVNGVEWQINSRFPSNH